MKIHLILLLATLSIILPTLTASGQSASNDQNSSIHFSDTTWYDKGFDFFIGGGMFIGNKFNANYYNGSNLNENSLSYIFDNEYWLEEMMELINTYYPYISITDDVHPSVDPGGDYNWETNYKLSLMVSLGLRYKIKNGWGIALSYSFSRLTTNSQCLLETTNDYGNQRSMPVMSMVGKEDRSMFDLSLSYLFSRVHPNVKPFFELGVQFNYAKVKSFNAMLLDQNNDAVGTERTLLDYYNGEGYYPGAQSYDLTFGGPGFGFSGALGVKIAINNSISIDPTFYCCASRTGIYQMMNSPVEGYDSGNKFALNYGIILRVFMNDFLLSKN